MSQCLNRNAAVKSCNDVNQKVPFCDKTPRRDDSPSIPICNATCDIPFCDDKVPPPITAKPEVKTLSDCPTCVADYTDFYCLGRLWIGVLKAAMLGFDLENSIEPLVPVVEAKCKEDGPQKPGVMKYSDLPLYKAPHFEYKDYQEKSKKCKGYNGKILHEALQPTVRSYRKSIQCAYKETMKTLDCTYKEVKADATASFNDFKNYFRDPKRSDMRQGVLITSSVLAYLLALKKSLTKRVLYTGVAALGTGFLCYPEATDEVVRTMLYHFGRTSVWFYNFFCKKVWNLRDRVPCERYLPQIQNVVGLKDKEPKKV